MKSKTTKKSSKKDWSAWVWVKWKAGTPNGAWKEWSKKKKIKEAWTTTGDWDCKLWIDAQDPDELEEIVWKTVRGNKWVDKTDTQWVKKWW